MAPLAASIVIFFRRAKATMSRGNLSLAFRILSSRIAFLTCNRRRKQAIGSYLRLKAMV